MHFGKLVGEDKMLPTLIKLRRTVIRAEQDKTFSAGQATDAADYLEKRFVRYVSSQL
ncbi:hypothetical protein D3C71_2073410 [compost metagenome]